ncbi:MAG: M20 family metallopeptidase [Ktedonobacteraceae bacterium]
MMNLQNIVLGVEEYTQQRLARYIDELGELCAIDTYTYHKAGLDELARLLAARMRGLGMDTTIIENEAWGNDLLGVIRGGGHGNVVLLGHMDTVYPVGVAGERPVRLENSILYGPGVCDMKGGILAGIYALEALLAQGYRDFGEIRFLCVSDEEITNRHCKETMRLVSRDCHGALVLEAARANGDIVSARKGNSWYTLTAHGRSAHAGVEPEKGRNAIIEIAHQTLQFQSLHGWREGVTVNAGMIAGGTMPNVVPELAQVQFDLRFLHPQDRLDTEEQWHKLMQQRRVPDVELTLRMEPDYKEPMVATAESMKLVQHAQAIAGLLGISMGHVLTGGASDGSYTSGYGVPTIDGLGPIGGRDHSPDEYLLASSVAPRTALLAGLIATIGAQ